jgi:hypothetical protein
MADEWFFDLGVQFLLGPWADQTIDRWQEGFLPVKLMQHVREVPTVRGPLVLSERTLHTSGTFSERAAPPGRAIPYFFVGMLIAAAGVGVGVAKRMWVRALAATVTLLWCVLAFVGGTLLMVLWLFTTHVPTVRNHNLLALNPLFGVLVVALPILSKPRICRLARDASAAIAVLSILAVILKVMPWSRQGNGDILAFAVTANLGMAAGIWLRCRGKTGPVPPTDRADRTNLTKRKESERVRQHASPR